MFMQVVKRYKSRVCIELNRHRPLPIAGSIGGVYSRWRTKESCAILRNYDYDWDADTETALYPLAGI